MSKNRYQTAIFHRKSVFLFRFCEGPIRVLCQNRHQTAVYGFAQMTAQTGSVEPEVRVDGYLLWRSVLSHRVRASIEERW